MLFGRMHVGGTTQQTLCRMPQMLLAFILAFSLALPTPALAYALDGDETSTSPDVAITPSETDEAAELSVTVETEATAEEPAAEAVETDVAPLMVAEPEVTAELKAEAEPKVAPVFDGGTHNLVLLVRFANDGLGNDPLGYNAPYKYNQNLTGWQYFVYTMNGGDPANYVSSSLHGYLSTISGGQHNLVNEFPQTNPDGTTVSYITLPGTFDSYYDGLSNGNDYSFVQAVAQAFNEKYPDYDASANLSNSGGYLNNLLIIPVVGKASVEGSSLWPHKANLGGSDVSVGKAGSSLTVDAYNIVDSASANIETLAHEYLHTLGAKDYYRKGGSGNPVSIWDVMGAGDVPFSLPLAITRQTVGWTNVPERSEANTYTLHAFGSGEQAFMFKSPLNDSEYFVVEYREKGTAVTDLDGHIGGSGLIVYRVNPAYAEEGNIAGNDYIYVFRPGETGLGDSAGDVVNAQVTIPERVTSVSRTSIGTPDLTADITQDTLCYSSGQNSGIVITPTAQTDDSITFTLEYPDYEQVDLWDALANVDGSGEMLGSEVIGVQAVVDGQNTYVALDSLRRYQVMKHDGSNWSDLGFVSSQGAYAGALAVKDDEVYFLAAGVGSDGSIALRKYDGPGWRDVAQVSLGAGVNANELAMEFVGEDLYVLVGSENSHARLYRLEGTSLQEVPATLPGTWIVHPVLFELNGNPAVACGDFTAQKSYVFELVGNIWVERSVLDGGSSNVNSVAHDGDTTYVYQCQNKNTDYSPKLLTFAADGARTGVVAVPTNLTSSLFDGSLVAAGGKLYLTLFDGQSPAATVKTFMADATDLNTWEQLGENVYSPANSLSSVISQDKILVATANGTMGQATVRTHELTAPVDPPVPVAALSLSHTASADLIYGYAKGSMVTFTLKNSGTTPVSGLFARLESGSASFVLGALMKTTLAPGETATFTCTTKSGLAAGTYEGNLRVFSTIDSQVSASSAFKQRVNPLDISKARLFERNAQSPGIATKTYNGKAQVLSSGWSVKVGVITLGSADVALSYANNINAASTASAKSPAVLVSAKNSNLKGTFKEKFSIVRTAPLAPGTYAIQSALADRQVLDIAAGSKSNSANAQLYSSNMSAAQRFKLSFDTFSGYYTIANANSGKVLDVAAASSAPGTNVAQYQSNGTKAQKWIIAKNKNGTFRITSALKSNLVLDIAGARAQNGGNVQVWTSNGTLAQSFRFLSLSPQAPLGKTVKNGVYTIRTASAKKQVVDVSGGSRSNGANVQLWTANGSNAQKFRITYGSDGYYTIRCVASNKALDIDGGNVAPGSNVQQWSYTADNANQKWNIKRNSDGTYTFIGKSSGLALDVQWGVLSQGSNLWAYTDNGSKAQKFTLS